MRSELPRLRETRYRTVVAGGYFHVYNRGVGKKKIFLAEDDYEFYLGRLQHLQGLHTISVAAYCLMPNHIHLLLHQNAEEPIAQFIMPLHTSYAKHFNAKYEQTGHLFEGRFQQVYVRNTRYLRILTAYIHLNPVEAGLTEKPEDYRWSSHEAYLQKVPDDIVRLDKTIEFFGSKKNYREWISDSLTKSKKGRWQSAARPYFIES